MNTEKILNRSNRSMALVPFIILCIILFFSIFLASKIQNDFGNVNVTNVTFENYNNLSIRAKLLKPVNASKDNQMPGIVIIHGHQSCRETNDAYNIELSRRGIVVLSIDAIGRGNSDVANDLSDPEFDNSYGGRSSLKYLKSLAFINPNSIGLIGHSIGGRIAYEIALKDPAVKGLIIMGFGYKEDATGFMPKNMLMIFGKWDEYRTRMTGTKDFKKEWMNTPQSKKAIPYSDAKIGETYGNFNKGTARRVFMPSVIHIQEQHSHEAVKESLLWMKKVLNPDKNYWIDADNQIWHFKELLSLIAMLSCFMCLIPLGLLFLRTKFFSSLCSPVLGNYSSKGKQYIKFGFINGFLMWLYLPLIYVVFGLYVYVVRFDNIFPVMTVNAIVWWFVVSNAIGFIIFKKWFKKESSATGLTLKELGISFSEEKFFIDKIQTGKIFLLAILLFSFAYLSEYILEQIFLIDFRFIFSFANDLTPYRWLMFLIYFPFLAIAFILNGIFLHAQSRRPKKETWQKTYLSSTLFNYIIMILPLVLFLLVQYIPLLVTGYIPFTGPGGLFVFYVINIFHIIGVLLIILPLSTWFYQLTGNIYLGAILNALIVTWMFLSSQVIAPIPI